MSLKRRHVSPRPLREFLNLGDARGSNTRLPVPVRSGFTGLDSLIGQLLPSNLIVLAGRPSAGKSSLLLNIAQNGAVDCGARVVFISLQNEVEGCAQRLFANVANIALRRLGEGLLSKEELDRIHLIGRGFASIPLYLTDSPEATLSGIRDELGRQQARGPIDLVVIDGLDFVRNDAFEPDWEPKAARELKLIARDVDAPVLVSVYLERGQGEPSSLTALGKWRALEDHADLVILLAGEHGSATTTKLIVAKHRNGPTGVVHLRFRNHLSRFEDLMVLEEESA